MDISAHSISANKVCRLDNWTMTKITSRSFLIRRPGYVSNILLDNALSVPSLSVESF